MKIKMIASTLIALSLAAGGSAFAQHDNHGDDHDKHHDDAQQYHRDDQRGGGPKHDLHRGQHLSKEYLDSRYVVNDWNSRHLSAPPKGHHWVRVGDDYVLTAIATGVIADVLLHN